MEMSLSDRSQKASVESPKVDNVPAVAGLGRPRLVVAHFMVRINKANMFVHIILT
jgi:hypothetical protein